MSLNNDKTHKKDRMTTSNRLSRLMAPREDPLALMQEMSQAKEKPKPKAKQSTKNSRPARADISHDCVAAITQVHAMRTQRDSSVLATSDYKIRRPEVTLRQMSSERFLFKLISISLTTHKHTHAHQHHLFFMALNVKLAPMRSLNPAPRLELLAWSRRRRQEKSRSERD